MTTCLARSPRSTSSPTPPYRGNPVAVVLDGDGLSTEEMQRFAHWTNLSETTFVLPPDGARGRLPGADLHPHPGTAVRRPPDARDLPRLARGRRAPRPATRSSRSAARDWSRSGARRRPGVRGAAAGPLRAGRRGRSSTRVVAALRHRPRRRSSTRSGPTTARAGWPCCWRARTPCSRCGPARGRPRHRRRRPVPAGLAAGGRGARLLPEGRRDRRGPGDRQPQRLAGPVADRVRPRHARRTSRARARRSAAPAACTSAGTPTAQSGSAAAR